MNDEKFRTCADVLGEISTNFTAMARENPKAQEAGLLCEYVRSLVLEYSAHLSSGMEPYDAMAATVNGELRVPEEKSIVLKVLTAKPKETLHNSPICVLSVSPG
jgi:hypothetical protein